MMIRNFLKYSFALLFWLVLFTVIVGWSWTKLSVKSSQLTLNDYERAEAFNFLSQFMNPFEEALCFHPVLEERKGETYTFHSYSFFRKSCGRVELIPNVYAKRVD